LECHKLPPTLYRQPSTRLEYELVDANGMCPGIHKVRVGPATMYSLCTSLLCIQLHLCLNPGSRTRNFLLLEFSCNEVDSRKCTKGDRYSVAKSIPAANGVDVVPGANRVDVVPGANRVDVIPGAVGAAVVGTNRFDVVPGAD